MAFDSSVLVKIKEKLKSIGAFIDDELPDYIMVMVANKKSEGNMAKDLQLFLGDHTVKFTEWLQSTLQKMKTGDYDSKTDASDFNDPPILNCKVVSKKVSLRPITKNNNELHSFETQHLESDPSDIFSKPISNYNFSREPHEDHVLVSFDSTEGLVKSSGQRRLNDSVPTSLRSVVQFRETNNQQFHKERPQLAQGTSLLLKRAVNETQTNHVEVNTDEHQAKRRCLTRPIACSDVSSSSQLDSTRFFITLSGVQSNKIQTITYDGHVDDNLVKNNKIQNEPNSITSLASRLGSRIIKPTQSHLGNRISAKHRLGPVLKQNNDAFNSKIPVQNYEFQPNNLDENEFDDMIEGDYVEMASDDMSLVQNSIAAKELCDSVHMSNSKKLLGDRLNQSNPELVVNLNEIDEDDEGNNASAHTEVKKKCNTDKRSAIIPSSLERCKFWPHCRNGLNCQYIHPTEQCTSFPHCRLGSTCIYIHPPCRFGVFCTRPGCSYLHSGGKRATPSLPINTSEVVCRFQKSCINSQCPFYHTSNNGQVMMPVKAIASKSATLSSVPCRYGAMCTSRPKCIFHHPQDIPKFDQLKWIAPSKRTITGGGESGAGSLTNNEVSRNRVASIS